LHNIGISYGDVWDEVDDYEDPETGPNVTGARSVEIMAKIYRDKIATRIYDS
jgi:hypothetical protein